jgi:hypothetical protein
MSSRSGTRAYGLQTGDGETGMTEMRHRSTETLYNYFNDLRGARPAPLRSEIEPAALTAVLPDIFILEKRRDGIVTFRLAGTRVCSILGQELRGHTFAEIWEPAVRHRMRLAADTVLANRQPLEIAVTAIDAEGESLALDMLMLPLCSRPGLCDRILGALAAIGRPDHPDIYRRLTPSELTFGNHTDAAPVRGAIVTPFGAARPVGHLRVLDGGRRD